MEQFNGSSAEGVVEARPGRMGERLDARWRPRSPATIISFPVHPLPSLGIRDVEHGIMLVRCPIVIRGKVHSSAGKIANA